MPQSSAGCSSYVVAAYPIESKLYLAMPNNKMLITDRIAYSNGGHLGTIRLLLDFSPQHKLFENEQILHSVATPEEELI